MNTSTPSAKLCRRCQGLGSRPCCPRCGALPPLTPEEQAAAVAAFRALRAAHGEVELKATHTISDATGRIVVTRV